MKKFIYRDSLNKLTEISNFEFSDFITSFNATSGLPVKTNSLGLIDTSLIPTVGAASLLQLTKTAAENILKGDCVYATSSTHVGVATNNSTFDKALVLGVSQNDALVGESVAVILMGAISDAIFSVFTVNQPLYLDDNGGLTDVRPTTPTASYLTPVAKSLGSNTIFIQISYPAKLGV